MTTLAPFAPLAPFALYVLIGFLGGLAMRRYAGITWSSVAVWALFWPAVGAMLLIVWLVMRRAGEPTPPYDPHIYDPD